jgi:hypothetical protein
LNFELVSVLVFRSIHFNVPTAKVDLCLRQRLGKYCGDESEL